MKKLVDSLLRTFVWATLLCGAGPRSEAAERVYVTEFMAANTRSLLDRDREHSDWIELHNAGSEPVNLEGWCLTDDRTRLNKWRFPGVVIGAGEYLVVFASEKGRRNPGGELHTNFKLSAEGEYLALVKPDGKTVASEFAPAFPVQVADASYGLAMAGPKTILISPQSRFSAIVPTRDLGMSWLTENYNDSSWLRGSNTVGFDLGNSYRNAIGVDARSAMHGKGSSAYVRIPFVVNNTEGIDGLQLRLRYDDGFVAYLNGWEVARSNAPTPSTWNSTASGTHGSSEPLAVVETFDAGSTRYWTSQNNAASRPRQHPVAPNSTNQYLRLVNGQVEGQANAVAFPTLPVQEFDALTIQFKYRYTGKGEGTERLNFLLIPTAVYGAEGPGIKLDAVQNLRELNLPGVFAIQILHNPENGQNALTVHWDGSKRHTAEIPSTFKQRQFHQAQIRMEETSDGVQMSIALTPDAGGSPQASHTAAEKLVIPGMKLGGQRAQFVGRIGNWDQTMDIDDLQLQLAAAGGLIPEEFDLSAHLSALRPGTNLLCLQGLNRSKEDPNFLLGAELLATMSAVRTNTAFYMSEPTPGAANRPGFNRLAPPPIFTTRGGVFQKSAKLELTAREGTVRYTVDGSEPSVNSPAYSSPVTLSRTTFVKAKTFLPDTLPSGTVMETFTIVDDQLATFSSNLPLILINTFGRYISPNNKSGVSIQFLNNKRDGRSTVLGPMDFNGRASVNLRGYSTLRQPKNSMTIRLKDENDDKIKASLFGLPKESDWVLYAPYADKTMIRDALAYELSNAMGQYAPRTRFVEVYLDRNGGTLGQNDYMGVYVLVERVGVGKSRVNIESLGPDDIQEPAISGGYLFKRDHSERYEPSFRTGRGNRFFYVEPKGNEITREQSAWLSRYVNQFEQALYGSDFNRPDRGYAKYLDVGSFIDQHWLIEMSKNIDGFRYSAYVHKDRNGKLRMGPAWDWNLSFGNADYHDGYDPKGWYTELLRETEICWFRRLSEDPEFMQRTIDRWGEMRQSVFARSTILKRVDEMAAELEEAQARNFRRWPLLGRSVNPNYFVGKTYREEIDWMKQWISKRLEWIDDQFIAPPAVKTNAGKALALSSSSGRIYYTTDGSDPRAPGGAPSPKAVAYKDAIPLGANVRIVARVAQRDQWSSPVRFPKGE